MLCYLQNNSYFTASFQGYDTRGAVFLFLHKGSSLAFRYVNGVVKLDNYDDRPSHTTTSFLFEIATIDNVKFSDDCVCIKCNKDHL